MKAAIAALLIGNIGLGTGAALEARRIAADKAELAASQKATADVAAELDGFRACVNACLAPKAAPVASLQRVPFEGHHEAPAAVPLAAPVALSMADRAELLLKAVR